MRTVFHKPAIQFALILAPLLAAIEGSLYFDHNRHASLRELALAAIFGLIYFAAIEGSNAKRFIIRGRETALHMMLTFSGFTGIVRVIEKLDEPSTTLLGQTTEFLGWMIVTGLLGASIDAVADYRRSKT
jgi:hypothetical protein